VTENTLTAPDLRVGDVIKWPDGRYYAVDTLPEPSRYPEEYEGPRIASWVTEMNADLAPIANGEKQVHSEDAVLDVLTPRPESKAPAAGIRARLL
jgi:hypothetical protein